jgi:arylsulfatase A-like enzyme
MDEQIGRILNGLKKSGMEKNTYVFFSADHGLAVGHHGLFGKQNLYEHSTRVPFIVKGPGIRQGAKTSAPIYLQDVMASSLALAGIEKPAHVEFNDILPLARGTTKKSPYEEIYGAYLNVQRSITKNNIKILAYPQVPLIRVYDLAKDPGEEKDIASTEKGKEWIAKLFPRLLKLQKKMGDSLDLTQSFPQFSSK